MEYKGLRFEIPFKTPTINHMYGHKFNGKTLFLKSEGINLRLAIQMLVRSKISTTSCKEIIDYLKEKKLCMEVFIYENWYTQKNLLKKKDIKNRSKFLTDSIFSVLPLDDHQIWDESWHKMQSEKYEKAIIIIKEKENE